MKLEDFFFPVEEMPVAILGEDGLINASNYKSIVRTDKDEVCSIVPKTYKIMRNQEIIESALDSFNQLYDTKISFNDSFVENNRMRLHLYFPDITINDGESDLALSFYIHNSYDRSEGVRFIAGFIRFICTNGMVVKFGENFQEIYFRHTKGNSIEKIKIATEKIIDELPKVKNKIEELKSKKVELEFIEKAKKEIGKKFVENSLGHQMPLNLWVLYNVFTYYISHTVALHRRLHYQQAVSKLFNL